MNEDQGSYPLYNTHVLPSFNQTITLVQSRRGIKGSKMKSSNRFLATSRLQDYQPRGDTESKGHIPCLYLPYDKGSSKLLIYFHGNAEDIGVAKELLDYVRSLLRVHVMAVEYPGYGVYRNVSPDANRLMDDAETVFQFLTENVGINESDIILFGRSIGSGPACFLAS